VQINSFKFKAVAVLVNRIVSALISLLFIPVYIKLLGIESYGLVTFYLLIVNVLLVVDFALSTAISRQVVILKTRADGEKSIKDLVYSIELIYWILSIVICGLIYLYANNIARHWIKANELSVDKIADAVKFIGVLIAFQLPSSIYNGIMISYGQQVANSIITIIVNVLKAAGVIAVLKIVAPTIQNYFIWNIVITALSTLVLRYFSWKAITVTNISKQFSPAQLKTVWKFALGMFGITIVNFILSVVDKLAVSKSVTLDLVACYNLAFQIAGVLGQIVSPLQSTIFPKFTELLAQDKYDECVAIYHKGCKWVAIIVWPIGLSLIFFGKEILQAWTKNDFVTINTATILMIVCIGTICNCLMTVPYLFMLSKGKTNFTFYQNLIGSVVFMPMLFWLLPNYGIVGASFVWFGINVSYILISVPLFHKLYMKNELRNWYLKDNAYAFLLSLAVIGAAKLLRLYVPGFQSNFVFFAFALLVIAIYVFLTVELRVVVQNGYQLLHKKLFNSNKN
jgi:O-antigen/teichoic acid export membrane protein